MIEKNIIQKMLLDLESDRVERKFGIDNFIGNPNHLNQSLWI